MSRIARNTAIDRFAEAVAERGGISRADARRVTELYLSKKIRAARVDVVAGTVTVTHGAFLERRVIRRALASLEGK